MRLLDINCSPWPVFTELLCDSVPKTGIRAAWQAPVLLTWSKLFLCRQACELLFLLYQKVHLGLEWGL